MAESYFCILPNSFLTCLKKPFEWHLSEMCSETNLCLIHYVKLCFCVVIIANIKISYLQYILDAHADRIIPIATRKMCGGQQVWQSCSCQNKNENHWMMLCLTEPPPPCRAGSLWALSSAESLRNRHGGWAWFCQHSSGFRKTLSDKQEPTMSHTPNFTTSDPKCIWQLRFESKYGKYVQSTWKGWPAQAKGFYRSQTDSRVCTTFEMEEHMKQIEGNNRKGDIERHWEKLDTGGAKALCIVRPS